MYLSLLINVLDFLLMENKLFVSFNKDSIVIIL